MTGPLTVEHGHVPVYRVVRGSWADPLDSSFSRQRPDNRWNTADFPALYCCCSERVARAVTLDVSRMAGVELSDLRAAARPQLVEIEWRGRVADMISPEGIAAAGFPADYPVGVGKRATREAAVAWHMAGVEGVASRSASLARQGLRTWAGSHEAWGEVAIFGGLPAAMLRRRDDWQWLSLSTR